VLNSTLPVESLVNTSTSRPGAATGSGLNSTASTIAKSAVLKPMPIASDAIATRLKAGLLRSQRTAYRMSAMRDSTRVAIIVRTLRDPGRRAALESG